MCFDKSGHVANAMRVHAQLRSFYDLIPHFLSSLIIRRGERPANSAVNCAMIHTWLGNNRSADCPITFGLWINQCVISTQFTVYGGKCGGIKAGLPYHRCTFSNQVHHCPNTAVQYPEQAFKLFHIYTVYNCGIILYHSPCVCLVH